MTTYEFVQYMPAQALADTIVHIYETIDVDLGNQVVDICWRQLVALVGENEATEMVFYQDVSEALS